MDKTFYQFGVLYLQWEHNGHIIEAVKEQVDFFGKEVFEQDIEYLADELDIAHPDGVQFAPLWQPTSDEIMQSIEARYSWMRDMEIM